MRHNKVTIFTSINFYVSDFVLIGWLQPQKVNKLTFKWTGPTRVLGFTASLVLKLRKLVDGNYHPKLKDLLVARLKFCSSTTLDVTAGLKEHLTYQQKTINI